MTSSILFILALIALPGLQTTDHFWRSTDSTFPEISSYNKTYPGFYYPAVPAGYKKSNHRACDGYADRWTCTTGVTENDPRHCQTVQYDFYPGGFIERQELPYYYHNTITPIPRGKRCDMGPEERNESAT